MASVAEVLEHLVEVNRIGFRIRWRPGLVNLMLGFFSRYGIPKDAGAVTGANLRVPITS